MAPHCSTCCCQSTHVPLDTPELPDSVKAHILSNEPPSASDLSMLRDYGISIDPYLTSLDTEIAALSAMQEELQKTLDLRMATLNDLREERRVWKERQQHVFGGLSPLRRLPLEILQEIFLFTLAESGKPDYTWFEVFEPEESPWIVRRVCRKWRMAARYPHLWTSLRITRTHLRPGLSWVRDVLDRSHSLPLQISFFWDEPRKDVSFGRIVLDELVQHSERWQYASFHCVARVFTQSMSALRGRLPKLAELNFHHWDLRDGDFVDRDPHPFEIAPSLTKAIIDSAVINLDYSQLKSLTSKALTPAAFRVLVSSPNLTYLADHSRNISSNDNSSQPRYLHPRLNTLLLHQCAQLNLFILPNLQHLEAGPTYASVLYPSLPIISQFLRISQCPLLSLTIHNCDLSIGPIPEILRIVPGLQRLSININSFTMENGAVTSSDEALNVLIHRLAERASSELSHPRLVPNLQSFAFVSCIGLPWCFLDATIVDMIRLRSGMESVSFTIHPKSRHPNLSDDDVARLRTIKNDGFNVSIVKQEMEYKKGIVFI